jgi:ribosomal protein L37AE/L43A
VSDLPEEEQQPFRKWLRGNDIYNADQYDMWKANPHKVWRECGKGWFSLIDDCEKELAGLGVEDKHWRQVKEKFGELRLYITTEYLADEIAQRVRNVTSKYVLKSSTTCELCGSEQGFLMSDSSRKITICQVCNSKLFNGVFHPTSTHKVPNR